MEAAAQKVVPTLARYDLSCLILSDEMGGKGLPQFKTNRPCSLWASQFSFPISIDRLRFPEPFSKSDRGEALGCLHSELLAGAQQGTCGNPFRESLSSLNRIPNEHQQDYSYVGNAEFSNTSASF